MDRINVLQVRLERPRPRPPLPVDPVDSCRTTSKFGLEERACAEAGVVGIRVVRIENPVRVGPLLRGDVAAVQVKERLQRVSAVVDYFAVRQRRGERR